ncbi:MAG: lysylphosphatidylglycerol synthase transmembrane domain-containing protein [Acidimicrobiales bacterium]
MRKRLIPKPLRRGIYAFVLLLVIEYLVVPQLNGARRTLHLLDQVNFALVGLGVALEVCALVSYAQLTRAVLPRESPRLFTLLRIDLTSLAVSHVVPAGTAGGTPIAIRLLAANGVRPADAGFALATQGIGSALVLNALLWIGLVVSIPLRGFDPLYVSAALVGVFLLAAFGVLVALLTKGEEWAAEVLGSVARRIPFLNEQTIKDLVHRLADRLRELGADRHLLVRAVLWALANWAFDMASLWVFLAAFGHLTSPDALVVAYGLANVLAVIPISPGGLGVIEGVLIPTLAGFGAGRAVATLGVISWRLVNFWLPIPIGGAAYLSLKVEPNSQRRRAVRLAELAQESGRAPKSG